VTWPGPRYFDTVSSTGGGALRIGTFEPVLFLASSSAQKSSVIGVPTDAVRAIARAGLAAGPADASPCSVNRRMGGQVVAAARTFLRRLERCDVVVGAHLERQVGPDAVDREHPGELLLLVNSFGMVNVNMP
jgi:hypothetical protein